MCPLEFILHCRVLSYIFSAVRFVLVSSPPPYPSLLVLQPCLGLALLHGFVSSLARVALPGAYAPVSIALRVTGTPKLPLCDKAVFFDEAC
jgi:hypothetical protein